ncbi:hypothetical protein [uncultured Algibacter sp.]|uniref:hypothetical protein n=1 Tax=uncultured Algibacter sp. TaxID=298659 RepID=UPI0026148049|nr:hypothetical protein [uncultured Algibacter sp.]
MNKKLSNKNHLKNWYFIAKNNIAMILLIPTLVGGIWQILSLLTLGFEYIRFFSVSQLVADGLLMIIVIPIIVFFPFLIYHMFKSIMGETIKKKNKYSFLRELFFLLISMFFLVLLIYHYMNGNGKPSSFFLFLTIMIYIPLIETYYILGERIEKKLSVYSRLFKMRSKSIIQNIITYILFLIESVFGFIWAIILSLSTFLLLILFFSVVDFLGDYFISDNLSNIKNVEETIKNEYGISPHEYSIKYFNDSYIFVEHITVSEHEMQKLIKEDKEVPKEIIILNFDSLFKQTKL